MNTLTSGSIALKFTGNRCKSCDVSLLKLPLEIILLSMQILLEENVVVTAENEENGLCKTSE